jgi:hypothetical protein
MLAVTVSSSESVVLVDASLTALAIKAIAEAFCTKDSYSSFEESLRAEFGVYRFRSYCVDPTGPSRRVTYSPRVHIEYLTYRGDPVAIAPAYAASFTVLIQEVTVLNQWNNTCQSH